MKMPRKNLEIQPGPLLVNEQLINKLEALGKKTEPDTNQDMSSVVCIRYI